MTHSIGDQLKQARLARGLTLDQAAQATRLRRHYLEALENNQRDALPSNVQGRGFLRLYASFLDLPVNDLLAAWGGQPGQQTAVQVASAFPLPEELQPSMPDGEVGDQTLASDAQPGSEAIFEELGKKLRQQRETLGLSLNEVERYTRLRQRYITALEEGHLEILPSPVQGRGMLSNYAAFLNLDSDALLLRFAEGLQARRIERLPQPELQPLVSQKRRPARQAPFWRRLITPDLLFGVTVVVIILFFALWTFSRINTLRSSEVDPTAPAISEILLTPASQQTALVPEIIPLDPGQTAVSGEAAGVENGQSEETQEPAATVTLALSDGGPTVSPINKDPLQIYIVARQRAWLKVVADDKVKFLGRIVPGNAYAFSGTKKLEMYSGNAQALQVFYNQNDLGTIGLAGEVVRLVFTADEGMMTPTPAFTATPTATKPATITPLPTATPRATATITPFVP